MRTNAWFAAVTLASVFPASAEERLVPSQYPTIQAAVSASRDGDHVVVAPGTYHEAIDLLGRQITLRSSGGAAVTMLDGSGSAASILTARSGESAEGTMVRGFTFRNGYGNDGIACNVGGRKGGAIFVLNAGLSVLDSVFEDNGELNALQGGAIFGCEADLAVLRSRFERNAAAFGGALLYVGTPSRRLTVEQSRFDANRASQGGAISATLFNDSSATVRNAQFVDNEAAQGGGILLVSRLSARVAVVSSAFERNQGRGFGGGINATLAGRSVMTLTGSRFDDNRSSHGAGAGITTAGDARATIADCDFANGVASFGGGAILSAADTSVIDVTRSRFQGHEAGFGGGVQATAHGNSAGTGGGRITISNSRLLDNVAHPCCDTGISVDSCFTDGQPPEGNGRFFGGGADLRTTGSGAITIAGSLFAGNSAPSGGGAAHASSCGGGTIDFVNTTVVDNGSGLQARQAEGGLFRVVNSIVRGNAGSDVDGPAQVAYSNVEGGYAGPGNMDADPRFADRAGRDYRLTAGSACIDAGDNTRVPELFRTDITDRPRFVDDPATPDSGLGDRPLVDLGAYEFQSARKRVIRR